MIKLIKTELWKLKRYSVLWIGIAAMLSVVLLTRFMAVAADGTVNTLENFCNDVIWNNFTLIYPATITLIAGYLIERERTDDTLKNLLSLPISFRRLFMGKVVTACLIAVILAVIEFLFTLVVFFISKYPGFSVSGAIHGLLQMMGMNLFVYIAVLPVIAFTGQREGTFLPGVAFAFFYGFIGTFASGHGLTSIYPVTAGLELIGYQGSGTVGSSSLWISLTVILLSAGISGVIIVFSHDRIRKQHSKAKKKRNAQNGQEVTDQSHV